MLHEPVKVYVLLVMLSTLMVKCAQGQQDHNHGHGDTQPVPFSYCKGYLEKLSSNDQHQLRESYQEYHAAFARFTRATRNEEGFIRGPPEHMTTDEERKAWNQTYVIGFDLQNLTKEVEASRDVYNNMDNRIKAQLQQLEADNSLPSGTHVDELSPCIMRKIHPNKFPDQPAVSLLLRLRGEMPNPGDWPTSALDTPEPPTGKGPEAVADFIKRIRQCESIAPMELVVMLSGPSVTLQVTTWAWQSWQSDGFVVPILDTLDREAHALNRLASVARGAFLVALRSDRPLVDDLFTHMADCSWLQRILTLYHRIPALGAMTHGRFTFSHPGGALRLLGSVPGASGPLQTNMFFKESMTSVPFQFALYGDYMPMSFRRSALEEVGGFDEDLPQGSGPCTSYLRMDLCLRLWKSGWRVGAHDAGLLQQPLPEPDDAGSNSDPSRCPPDIANLAVQLLNARHNPPEASGDASSMALLGGRVRELNMGTLEPLGPDALKPCPMEQGC